MAATASIKIVKTMHYRGGDKVWSNRYHFDGTTPPDFGHWQTLADAVVAQEKAIYQEPANDTLVQVEIIGATGYAPGSDVPVFSKSYTQAATGAFASFGRVPGDCAALLRYSTTQRTSKNHPIYLFNYFHGAELQASVVPDTLNTQQQTAILAYANDWISGFSDGAVTHHRAGPNGAVAQGAEVDDYITHRDFPR